MQQLCHRAGGMQEGCHHGCAVPCAGAESSVATTPSCHDGASDPKRLLPVPRAGRRNCFHSVAEVAACLDAQARSAGLRTVYIATNADVREQAMLREGITAAVVLFWQDVEGLLGGSSNGEQHGCGWSA